jgi:hypothetical protein
MAVRVARVLGASNLRSAVADSLGMSLPRAIVPSRRYMITRRYLFVGGGQAAFADEVQQILAVQAGSGVGAVENSGGELAFFLVQGQHGLLDGATCDHADHGDRPNLTDAVGAVSGLIFDRGVPPWIQVNDVGGGGQVQAGAVDIIYSRLI